MKHSHDGKNKEQGLLLLILTMKHCSGHSRSVFVEEHIPLTVILLTLGELGIPPESSITPSQMRETRRKEFDISMHSLGATGVILDFQDLHLSLGPIEPVASRVLKEVRERDFGVIFSFHPHEITPRFDHPDHNTAGRVTQMVAASSDVKYFYPHLPAVKKRPEFYYWTTNRSIATHKRDITLGARHHRNHYLTEVYPSQFPKESKSQWVPIFDFVTYQKEQQAHEELYVNIR